MANPAPITCDMPRVLRECYALLGIANPNNPDAILPGSPFTSTDITNKALQSDFEIRRAIAASLNHPLRNALPFADSDPVSDQGKIPAFDGEFQSILISSNGETRPGELAQHLENLNNHRYHSDVYGDQPFMYWIENGILHLSDPTATAVMKFPHLTINRSGEGEQLSAPVGYEWGVIGLTLTKCYIHQRDADNINFYASLINSIFSDIAAHKLSIPKPDTLNRLAS